MRLQRKRPTELFEVGLAVNIHHGWLCSCSAFHYSSFHFLCRVRLSVICLICLIRAVFLIPSSILNSALHVHMFLSFMDYRIIWVHGFSWLCTTTLWCQCVLAFAELIFLRAATLCISSCKTLGELGASTSNEKSTVRHCCILTLFYIGGFFQSVLLKCLF